MEVALLEYTHVPSGLNPSRRIFSASLPGTEPLCRRLESTVGVVYLVEQPPYCDLLSFIPFLFYLSPPSGGGLSRGYLGVESFTGLSIIL